MSWTARTREIAPKLTWTPKTSTTRTTVHAGRMFDGRTTRENVDIVIEGNRIARVEAHRADLHTGTVVDASTGTVLPGLIESHAHFAAPYGERFGRIWLSFGITTVRNPAVGAFEGQEIRETFEAGVQTGPRIFTTGEPFDGTRIYYPGGTALDGGAELSAELARAQALGYDFIKTYVRLPDLLQRHVIEEAHRMGMPVTSHEIYPAVAYGADGVEHIAGTSRRGFSPKISELRRSYRDVIDLLSASGMTLDADHRHSGRLPDAHAPRRVVDRRRAHSGHVSRIGLAAVARRAWRSRQARRPWRSSKVSWRRSSGWSPRSSRAAAG